MSAVPLAVARVRDVLPQVRALYGLRGDDAISAMVSAAAEHDLHFTAHGWPRRGLIVAGSTATLGGLLEFLDAFGLRAIFHLTPTRAEVVAAMKAAT